MSQILKTHGTVLRIFPFSETSHIVRWITADFGPLSTVIKGACRPKSPFLGQYDQFYSCELLFYARERNGLHIAEEISPLLPRYAVRGNWRSLAAASYACDLVSRTSAGSGNRADELYHLTQSMLDFIADGTPRPPALFWFELQLAGALGVAPQLTRCAGCQAPSASETDWRSCTFSPESGGVLCPSCSRRAEAQPAPLPGEVLTMLRRWQTSTAPRLAHNTRCSSQQVLAIYRLLGMFMDYHFDTVPESRRIALNMLALPRETLLKPGRSPFAATWRKTHAVS